MDNAQQLTMETEARRYQQIRGLERQLDDQDKAIDALKDSLKDAKERRKGLIQEILAAARNEGKLPSLFDGLDDAA